MNKKTVRILVIGPTPPPYHGVALATQFLLDSGLKEEFELSYLDTSDRRGIEHVDKPDLYDVFLFLKQWFILLKVLFQFRPRIVHIPLSQSTIGFLRDSFFFWPSVSLRGRVIFHLHGGNFRTWYEKRSGILRAYARLVLEKTTKVIVLGEALQVLFEGLMAPGKLAVVPNGIPWNNVTLPPDKISGVPGRYRIVYLGTLNRFKGVLALLSSISFVINSRQDVQFVFAGPWSNAEDRREAESVISKRGLSRFVTFVGPVKDEAKRVHLQNSDLFVFPGIQQEGQPLVVLEAMAAGLPVLFTNRGCLKETVIEGENGMEILPDDPYDLAAKLLWLLDHPLEMKKMGEQSRLRYEKCYTIGQFTENMIHVFNDVAKDDR